MGVSEADTERGSVKIAVIDHLLVSGLEDAQRKRGAGQQNLVQREDWEDLDFRDGHLSSYRGHGYYS